MYCILLSCTVLYCIVLYCIVLYCIILYCIILYCIVLGRHSLVHLMFFLSCNISSFFLILPPCIVPYCIAAMILQVKHSEVVILLYDGRWFLVLHL